MARSPFSESVLAKTTTHIHAGQGAKDKMEKKRQRPSFVLQSVFVKTTIHAFCNNPEKKSRAKQHNDLKQKEDKDRHA